MAWCGVGLPCDDSKVWTLILSSTGEDGFLVLREFMEVEMVNGTAATSVTSVTRTRRRRRGVKTRERNIVVVVVVAGLNLRDGMKKSVMLVSKVQWGVG